MHLLDCLGQWPPGRVEVRVSHRYTKASQLWSPVGLESREPQVFAACSFRLCHLYPLYVCS